MLLLKKFWFDFIEYKYNSLVLQSYSKVFYFFIFWYQTWQFSTSSSFKNSNHGPTPMCGDWESERISHLRRSCLRSEGSQPHSPAWSTSTWKKSPHNSWLWKSAQILPFSVKQKAAANPCVHLKVSHIGYLHLRHSPWARAEEWWLQRCQKHTGRDWVIWLQGMGWRDSHHCPCVELSFCVAGGQMPSFLCWALFTHGSIWIFTDLANSTCSILVSSWDPFPLN